MHLGLTGKPCIVTGGASGIGAAIVADLVAEGATVIVMDQNPCTVPGIASSQILDLTDDAACAKSVAHIREEFGPVYGLVNNAGLNDGVGLDAGPDAFRASLNLNLVQYYTLMHHLHRDLRETRGAVVNVASKTAVTGQGGTSAYVAAKAGVLGLTREWAAELAQEGVRVNAVLPAEVMTPMYQNWLSTLPEPDQMRSKIEAAIPLSRRMTESAEIAAMVVFLLSARSGHTTGQWMFVDGGYVHLDRKLTL
ncbi:SDR family oxidoreductase [Rhodobacteraceae bacterium XHP0102]|nr:SDR family oxidoreductase [Rhodobacteraceae bacterium XHP0102]